MKFNMKNFKRFYFVAFFIANFMIIVAQDVKPYSNNYELDSLSIKQEKVKLYVSYPEIIDESALSYKYHILLTAEGIIEGQFDIFAKVDGLLRFLKFKNGIGLVVNFNEYINLLSAPVDVEIIDENKILEKYKKIGKY